MRISVRHQLRFDLGSGAPHAVQQVLLTPRNGPSQTVVDWKVEMEGISDAAIFDDAFGNIMHLVSQTKPEGEKLVTVTGIVETHDKNGVLGRIAGEPVPALFKRITDLTKSDIAVHGQFLAAEKGYGKRIGLLHRLMERIGELYSFGSNEPAEAPQPEQSQSQAGQSQSQGAPAAVILDEPPRRRASAEDFARLFVGAARALDIPARFVTGYLAGSDDAEASFHAWAEAYDDALGWIAFDAALGYCPTDQHIRLATGLDAQSTTPLRCVPHRGAPEIVEISVDGGQQ